MENQFIFDAENLPQKILEQKHRLENDPSARINHMEFLPDMEQINSDVREKVLAQMIKPLSNMKIAQSTTSKLYYRLPPLLILRKWLNVQKLRRVSTSAIPFISLRRFISPITAKIIAFTAVLIVITKFVALSSRIKRLNTR